MKGGLCVVKQDAKLLQTGGKKSRKTRKNRKSRKSRRR